MEEGDGRTAALDCGSIARRDENLVEPEPEHSIFLSHSGAQKNFVEQLCLDIEAHDRYAFFDKFRESLSVGCNFPNMIFKAIKQCQVAVVVLSEEFFARSKWPMLELSALVKRKTDDPKLIIMPVFLGLTHAQCCEKGNHDRWLKRWECWAEKDKRIIVEEWQAALQVFGYTNGISLSRSSEVRCRQEIVEAICKEVPPKSRWDDSHVQGRLRLCEVIWKKVEDMTVSKCYGVRILGLYGVAGIGKSTACQVLCNEYFKEFHGRVCHVEFGDGNELQMLQKILKKLTNTKHEVIENLNKDECKDRMKRTIKNQRVLLAIDNVSESHYIVEQAKDMMRLGFEHGSIIIVTARSLGRLQSLNIHESECIEMPELTEYEAMNLFLYHTSASLHLKDMEPSIEQLTRQCVQRCSFGKGNGTYSHYHPLALKVLGGQLGSNPEQWCEKLKENDPFNQYHENEDVHPIFSILGRSFDTLNDEDRSLFLDAAIFYPSPRFFNIFEWMSMVHGTSIDAIVRKFKGLKRRSLLESLGDGSEKIGMHDLWREFAFMKSKAGKFDSRPSWSYYEKVYGLHDPRREEPSSLFESLQRVSMVGDSHAWCVVKEITLSCCSNLRVLKLVDVYPETQVLDVGSLHQLKSLEIIYRYTRSSNLFHIPGLECLRNLLFLHLDGIQTDTLCEPIGRLTSLHALRMRPFYNSSSTAGQLPDFSRLNSLRVLSFNNYTQADVASGFSSQMTNLKLLSLRSCDALRSCHGVGDLEALEELDLSWCGMLQELPCLGRLKNLLKLKVSRCKVLQAVPGLGGLVSLQVFAGDGCSKLAELPGMHKLGSLKDLDLTCCPSIKAMPALSGLTALEHLKADYGGLNHLRKLTKLKTLLVQGWSAEGLRCLSDLVNLETLSIRNAQGVDELTGLLNLTRLQELVLDRCGFKDVPSVSNLTALTSIAVSDCTRLENLPDMHRLTRLKKIDISDCKSLREWKSYGGVVRLFGVVVVEGTLVHLQTLELRKVAFTEVPVLSSYFPHLRELTFDTCEELTRLTSSAPLTALQSVSLCDCRRLRALPDLSHLVSLRSFTLRGCGVQLTAREIAKLETMCPGLVLEKGHLPNMEQLDRVAKRLKS